MTSQYDVLGLGNAIVDVISMVDDDLLAREKLAKGGMMLIDEARTESLYKQMGSTSIISGGSAANTIVGAASFGAKTAFIGKVKAARPSPMTFAPSALNSPPSRRRTARPPRAA